MNPRSFKLGLRSLLSVSIVIGPLCNIAASAQSPYKVIDQWKIGGAGGWDYLLADSNAHLLYVTHGTKVEVIDTATGKLKTEITGFKGTHGIAVDTSNRYGYISDGGGNVVVVFDRHTFAAVATIPAGANPDGISKPLQAHK